MKRVTITVLALLLCVSVVAQDDVDGDGRVRMLLPVALGTGNVLPGAYDTLWAMELWMQNRSSEQILSLQPGSTCLPPCDSEFHSGYLGLYGPLRGSLGRGALLQVSADIANQIDLSARLLELTRRAQPTGVNVPIIRERQFLNRQSALLGIPSGDEIRTTLRVYDPLLQPGSSVRLDILNPEGEVIGTLLLFPGNDPVVATQDRNFATAPGVDAILNIAAEFPQVRELERYHLVLTPQDGATYWAMASVTDNETQHVLLITPE